MGKCKVISGNSLCISFVNFSSHSCLIGISFTTIISVLMPFGDAVQELQERCWHWCWRPLKYLTEKYLSTSTSLIYLFLYQGGEKYWQWGTEAQGDWMTGPRSDRKCLAWDENGIVVSRVIILIMQLSFSLGSWDSSQFGVCAPTPQIWALN